MLTAISGIGLALIAGLFVIRKQRVSGNIEAVIPALCSISLSIQLNIMWYGTWPGTFLTLSQISVVSALMYFTSLTHYLLRYINREEC